jgi:hypothetical protein
MKIPKKDLEGVMATAIMDLIAITLVHAPKCNIASCKTIALWDNNHVKMCDKHCVEHKAMSPKTSSDIKEVPEQKRLKKFIELIDIYMNVPKYQTQLDELDPDDEEIELVPITKSDKNSLN